MADTNLQNGFILGSLLKLSSTGTESGVHHLKITDQSQINLWELADGFYYGDGEIEYTYNETTGEYIYGAVEPNSDIILPVAFVVNTDSANEKSIQFFGYMGNVAYEQNVNTTILYQANSNDGILEQTPVSDTVTENSNAFVTSGAIYTAIQNALIVDTETEVE